MIQLSELLSKKILNVYSSKIEGVVSSAICKDKKISYLQFFNESEEEYILDTGRIYSLENGTIVIKNSKCTMPATNLKSNNRLIGIDVFNEKGLLLGQIEEIFIGDNWKISSIKVGSEEYDASKILNINDVAIVKENDNISLASFKPKVKKIWSENKANRSVKIMPLEEEKDNITLVEQFFPTVNNKENEYKISPTPSPQKVIGIGSGEYLIGRKTTKTIYGLNNEIVAKKDTYITSDILNKAKGHNKLMELALYSRVKSKK